jgi:penicillin-binding protein 1C
VKTEIFEFWPSDLQRLFRDAGMPRRQPPAMPDCGVAEDQADDGPVITSPNRGATYTMRLSKMAPIALRANSTGAKQTLYWFANGGLIGKSQGNEGLGWLPPGPGRYQLRVIDQYGQADAQEVEVEFIP